MPNMQPNKTPIPEQDPMIRAKNFSEVSLGYEEAMAISEAQRCLQCRNQPCMQGCPVNVRIPEFIGAVAEGNMLGAYEIIRSTNALPAICGRVCPQESQCEKTCLRGIKGEPVGIGRLERFVADWAMAQGLHMQSESAPKPLGKKVAVIGSGPAGLSCAGDLAKLGYEVTVFEALHQPGGVLVYGIPEFRLPKALVADEIRSVANLGVDFQKNIVVGRTVLVDELIAEGYQAIFIGTGAGLPSFLGIPGENLNNVYSANEFLTRVNLMHAYRFPDVDTPIHVGKQVAVVGGGNVAMDAARCALRLGAEKVYIVYRRGEDELPARAEEVHHAKEEGIDFQLLRNPTRLIGNDDGNVIAMEVMEMGLGEPDASGRRRPVAQPGTEYQLEVESVIIAVGTAPNPLIKETTKDLEAESWGGIKVFNEAGATSRPGIYAGGDAVTGAATVILAMGAGKQAATAIHAYLQDK